MSRRKKIIAAIERGIAQWNNRPRLCLYYAHETITVLRRYHYQAVIQAGSMQWPRVRREEDDGVMNTHFAYEWGPTPESAMSVTMGNLPEMHIWVGIVNRQEIVDFTTRHLKASSQAVGMPWTASDPPQYLWCAANATPDWVIYRPNREASIYASMLLKRLFNPAYLRGTG